MSISLSELPDCYVVVWSPREDRLHIEKVSEMVARNLTFFWRERRGGAADWLVVGVARTAQGAEEIHTRADQKRADARRPPTPETDAEIDAAIQENDAAIEALESGAPWPPQRPERPPQPKNGPWWISEK